MMSIVQSMLCIRDTAVFASFMIVSLIPVSFTVSSDSELLKYLKSDMLPQERLIAIHTYTWITLGEA